MLTDKEVFKIIKSLDQIMEAKSYYIARERKIDKDEVKNEMFITSFNMFKKSFNPKKSKPITFFLNFCIRRFNQVLLTKSALIKYPHHIVEKGLYKKFSYISLDINVGDDENNDLYDLFGSYEDETINKRDTINYVNKILKDSKLNTREKNVIQMYYGINKDKEYSLKEIGSYYDLSKERIRQIRDLGLKKIKNNIIV